MKTAASALIAVAMCLACVPPALGRLTVARKTASPHAHLGERYVHANFRVRNTGKYIIRIKKILVSCGCTSATVTHKLLLPGQKAVVHVRVHLMPSRGKITRVVTLLTDIAAQPIIRLRVVIIPLTAASFNAGQAKKKPASK